MEFKCRPVITPEVHFTIDSWLRATGLASHIDRIKAAGIGLDLVSQINEADLRELGLNIGDRKRFTRAAEELDLSHGRVGRRTLPERRPVTIVLVDLVDSTSLSERLDPEDLLDVTRSYRDFCGRIIVRFGGEMAGFLGDGILAYFGYPTAHGNDPERALRACLEITRGIVALTTPAAAVLQVRIGVATGSVVISDLLAGGTDEKRSVSGSTPNLASRLQGVAPPNGIIASIATYRRVQNLFACEVLGDLVLKGFGEPQEAVQVLRELPPLSRRSILQAGYLTPLFGRDAELQTLSACWKRAEAREGCVALVIGEPGIGKSRLVNSFLATRRWLADHVVRVTASPFDNDSPLHPFLEYFKAAIEQVGDGSDEARLSRLRVILRGSEEQRERAERVLPQLLGLSAESPASPLVRPSQVKQEILDVMHEQLLLSGDGAPLCLIVEDLHWLDPTSHEFLVDIAGRLTGRPVLLLLTSRDCPDLATYCALERGTVLRLGPLPDADLKGMLRSLLGGRRPPDYVVEWLARRTEGVPLFVEEFLRPMLGQVDADWSDLVGDETGPVSIPSSLHEALVARLDNSGAAKEVAQIASVLGRQMRRDVLRAAADMPHDQLDLALRTLQEASVIRPHPERGDDWFAFGHALLRDAAYESILRDRRRELHARVAVVLEVLDPETVRLQPELLAFHLSNGGLPARAIPLWLTAARRSLARSALLEASRLLQRGLNASEVLVQTPDILEQKLECLALLGPVLIALKGPGSAEALSLYDHAYALCESQPQDRSHFPIYWGWQRLARNYNVKHKRVGILLRRAMDAKDPDLLLQAHHCNWAAYFEVGDFKSSRQHIEAGLDIYHRGNYAHHAALYGNHDAKVCAHGELAQVLWMQGHPCSARAAEQESRAWAKRIGHIGSRVHAMDMGLLLGSFRRNHSEVLRLAEELMDFAEQSGFADHRSKARIFRGWARSALGNPAEGLEELRAGFERQREIGTPEDFPMYVCKLAEVLAESGKPEVGLEELRLALREFDAIGLRIWLPEVWRTIGQLTFLADPGAAEDALASFRRAIAEASAQHAGLLKVRAAVGAVQPMLLLGEADAALKQLRASRQLVDENDFGPDTNAADRMLQSLEERCGFRGKEDLVL